VKDFSHLLVSTRVPNILISLGVILYIFSSAIVGDTIRRPELLSERIPVVLLWIAIHFAIGWAASAHAWNGLISTLDTAVEPFGWDRGTTEHQERLEGLQGAIGGTRMTFIIASLVAAVITGLVVLAGITSGRAIDFSIESIGFLVLFCFSPGLFAFASWAFLNGTLSRYYLTIRPAIDKAQAEVTGNA